MDLNVVVKGYTVLVLRRSGGGGPRERWKRTEFRGTVAAKLEVEVRRWWRFNGSGRGGVKGVGDVEQARATVLVGGGGDKFGGWFKRRGVVIAVAVAEKEKRKGDEEGESEEREKDKSNDEFGGERGVRRREGSRREREGGDVGGKSEENGGGGWGWSGGVSREKGVVVGIVGGRNGRGGWKREEGMVEETAVRGGGEVGEEKKESE